MRRTPDVAKIDRTPVSTPISGAADVVSTLIVARPPGCSSTTSVNVPPMSAAKGGRLGSASDLSAIGGSLVNGDGRALARCRAAKQPLKRFEPESRPLRATLRLHGAAGGSFAR